MNSSPPVEADIRLITGDQRNGKTTVLVAYPKDDYYAQLTGIISPSGNVIKAKFLTPNDKDILRQDGIIPHPFRYVRVFSPDGKDTRIIRIPQDYLVQSPVRIFANLHLFGLKYKYLTLAEMLEFINSDIVEDAWVLSDESAWTDPRNSMTSFGKLIAGFGATVGKRNVHFCQATQYWEMIERRFRLFWTTKCLCTYDKDTKMITVDMTKKGEETRSDDVYAPYYFPNFDTRERPPVPEKLIQRALEAIENY